MLKITTLATVSLLAFGCAMGPEKTAEELTPEEREFCNTHAALMLHDLGAPEMEQKTSPAEDLANALDPMHFVDDNLDVETEEKQDKPAPGADLDGVTPVLDTDDTIDKEIITEVDMVNATYLEWHIVCP